MRIEQGSDILCAHFCLWPEFAEGHFEVVDFRCVSLGPYLVLDLDLFLERHLRHVVVLEAVNFIF